VIELSLDEARRLKHQYVGSEYVLLGLLREGQGIGSILLEASSIQAGDLVLDLGAGTGVIARQLALRSPSRAQATTNSGAGPVPHSRSISICSSSRSLSVGMGPRSVGRA
jgi:cyclopropane fatty-acyl-phospholipid synthase-like methyltransferase